MSYYGYEAKRDQANAEIEQAEAEQIAREDAGGFISDIAQAAVQAEQTRETIGEYCAEMGLMPEETNEVWALVALYQRAMSS
tara:strand:- start:1392 stop:1637 length:246 start_codon:yes stop_codon:yes gene_type:complete